MVARKSSKLLVVGVHPGPVSVRFGVNLPVNIDGQGSCLGERRALAIFNGRNFYKIIHEIELMEDKHQNIWVPIGILEYMYEDDIGYTDQYFHTDKIERDKEKLWKNLQKIFDK